MLTVGIFGAGGMGNVHAKHYRKLDQVDIRFFDPDEERSTIFAQRHQCVPSGSAEELFESVDAVDICLPTDLHVPIALQAIAAGKAVLVEKPIAGSITGARALVDAAETAGVPLMAGHVVRFFREYAKANQVVKSGGVGTPAAVRMRRGGLAPTGKDSWFMDHHRSGGVLIDLAIHEFDWLRWTFGEVSTVYSQSLGAKTMAGPDYALTTLKFDSGVVAHVESTWMDPSGFRVTFEVCGSEGMIEHDSRAVASLRTHAQGKTILESPLDGGDDPFFNEVKAFTDAVAAKQPMPISGRDGLGALAIALAAVESAKTGRLVKPERP